MPKVVKKGQKTKEFSYTAGGMAAAEKSAKESGGKIKLEKGFKRGAGKKK